MLLSTETGLLLSVLVEILIGRVIKHLGEQQKERDYLFWLTVSEGSLNPCREGLVEQLTPQKGDVGTQLAFFLFSVNSSESSSPGTVPSTF